MALREQVPVINFSLGKGDWLTERVHGYGGKVGGWRAGMQSHDKGLLGEQRDEGMRVWGAGDRDRDDREARALGTGGGRRCPHGHRCATAFSQPCCCSR